MTEVKTKSKKSQKSNKKDQIMRSVETSARRAILEDLFYDFHSSRRRVYAMNFFRGLFFGFGSVIGATLLIAIAIWLLTKFGDIFPPLADFINRLTDTMQRRR